MIDIRLDDVKEHELERQIESAWLWAVIYQESGHVALSQQHLDMACSLENELIDFRQHLLSQLIDWE